MEMRDALYALLEPLGLYRLHQGSLVDAELEAFLAGFSMLEEALEELRAQAFVRTAFGEGLLLHGALTGLQERAGSDAEIRRELILRRRSISPADFTMEGMVKCLYAAGMEAEIVEHPTEERLTIRSRKLLDRFADEAAVKARVEAMLPAHLESDYHIGLLTWDMLEAAVTWERWDALDFTWIDFDLDGHTLFGPEARAAS